MHALQTNLSSLVEHIYTKFYETYKDECPIVFDAIRLRYEDSFGAASNPQTQTLVLDKIKFVQQNAMDDDEEMYWEKDDEPTDSFVPTLAKASLSEVRARCGRASSASALWMLTKHVLVMQDEISCRDAKPPKLVDYNDDDDDDDSDASRTSLKDGDLRDPVTSLPSSLVNASDDDNDDDKELKLPVRKTKADDDATSFFAGIAAQKSTKTAASLKKVRSPKVKSMFQKISWKQGDGGASKLKLDDDPSAADSSSADSNASASKANGNDSDDSDVHDSETSALLAKRKLELEEAQGAEAIVKKSKTGTPISSS